MKSENRRLTNRTRFMLVGAAVFLLIAYFVVAPTVAARQYVNRIQPKTARAKADLKAVSTGSNTVIFDDPDIALAKRQEIIGKAQSSLRQAQRSLDNVDQANKLARLPGNGFAGQYHRVQVRQKRTYNAVRQSRQVLAAYAATLAYIQAYTEPQLYLDQQLTYINGVQDFGTVSGQGNSMKTIAARLQASHDDLAKQTPPPDFAPLQTDALQTLAQAASAFERLGEGLNRSSDADIDGAISVLENIALKADGADREALTSLAQDSPLLLQLADLPEKIENSEQY